MNLLISLGLKSRELWESLGRIQPKNLLRNSWIMFAGKFWYLRWLLERTLCVSCLCKKLVWDEWQMGGDWWQRLSQHPQSPTAGQRDRLQAIVLSETISPFSFRLSIPGHSPVWNVSPSSFRLSIAVTLGHHPRWKPCELTSSVDSHWCCFLNSSPWLILPLACSLPALSAGPVGSPLMRPTLTHSVCDQSFLLCPYHTETQLLPRDTRF